MVRRIYVEKRKGFDIEAQKLYEDLKETLSLKGLQSIRVINRYDIEGIDDDTYDLIKYTIFAEPAIDVAYDEILTLSEDSILFAVEYLPGQYDQRADSASQCIRLIHVKSDAVVRFARCIVLNGKISDSEIEAIKDYCINPVDSQEASLEKPENLGMSLLNPNDIEYVNNFILMSDEELISYRDKLNFTMSINDLKFIKDYFKDQEKRNPTITELRVLDTYWSDHCRHTTFLTKINSVEFVDGKYSKLIKSTYDDYLKIREEVYGSQDKDVSLMDIAVIGSKYLKKKGLAKDIDESEEINACSINVKAKVDGKDEDWLVMFKNETHNHPTEIEPFGGAATCLGGAIRDPLSGRVYVYQAMRVTGSGDPRTKLEDTIKGKLPQRKITKDAAKGYSSYGNQIGLSTGQVSEIYDKGYIAKRMEVGAVIGAAPAKNVVRKKPLDGDLIILVGGRTGRDGCGGATGSSKGHTEESILHCGAEVQKGNPPVERNIQRLFRREEVTRLIKKCNDFGAGGVSVAIGELADSIDINLNLVPKKYEGLDGTEIAISESQERMAVVVSMDDSKAFIKYALEENLEASVVARVTDTGRFRMFWRGNCILDLRREFLNTNGIKQETTVSVKGKDLFSNIGENRNDNDLYQCLNTYLKDLNCCSQKGLVEIFDSTIGASTVLMPLGGKYQLTPSLGMAAKLPVTSGFTDTATLMSYGFDPQISSDSPFHGALYAVIDSTTKIAAMGGDISNVRLTFQEYFEKLGEDPEKWAKPFTALLGALKAQIELGIPAIGGKDSMSGTFMDLNVPPTLISFAVSVADANHVISSELKRESSNLIYLTTDKDENDILNFNQYKENMNRVRELALKGKILSANNIGKGGIFISLVKMAVGNKIGVNLNHITDEELIEQDYGALILEIGSDENLEELFQGTNYRLIGNTTKGSDFIINKINQKGDFVGIPINISISEILQKWTEPLDGIFPADQNLSKEHINKEQETVSYKTRESHRPAIKIAKPRVFIPVFPGTNCEVDSKRAFERAGAIGDVQILKNLKQDDLINSIEEMAKKIKNSQILMIPGGFSGGDEPDGSAKFITAVFRNPIMREAISDLLDNRDGLILGICNGFQALIKLGLVPYGKITEQNEDSPTLTYNQIGRHVSCLVRTRIASVKSPWLSKVEVGDIHTIPVSHGEGRFIASNKVIDSLIRNGQIATQYVNLEGIPTLDFKYNPNYSTLAIEGITSPDGRIFGKMGHSERIGNNLYKNVAGEYDQRIFEAGVDYFL